MGRTLFNRLKEGLMDIVQRIRETLSPNPAGNGDNQSKRGRTHPLTQEQVDFLNDLFGCNTRFSPLEGLRVSLYLREIPPIDQVEIARRLKAGKVIHGGWDADVFMVEQGQESRLPRKEGLKIVRFEDYRDLFEGPAQPRRQDATDTLVTKKAFFRCENGTIGKRFRN